MQRYRCFQSRALSRALRMRTPLSLSLALTPRHCRSTEVHRVVCARSIRFISDIAITTSLCNYTGVPSNRYRCARPAASVMLVNPSSRHSDRRDTSPPLFRDPSHFSPVPVLSFLFPRPTILLAHCALILERVSFQGASLKRCALAACLIIVRV